MGLDSRIKLFPKFSIGEIIGFRLMELLLKPLLPKESYVALQPYLNAARSQREIMPKWDETNTWEKKVRVVPPTQPLLPPVPSPALLAKMSREQWQSNQDVIRDAIPVSYTHLDVYKRQIRARQSSSPAQSPRWWRAISSRTDCGGVENRIE